MNLEFGSDCDDVDASRSKINNNDGDDTKGMHLFGSNIKESRRL